MAYGPVQRIELRKNVAYEPVQHWCTTLFSTAVHPFFIQHQTCILYMHNYSSFVFAKVKMKQLLHEWYCLQIPESIIIHLKCIVDWLLVTYATVWVVFTVCGACQPPLNQLLLHRSSGPVKLFYMLWWAKSTCIPDGDNDYIFVNQQLHGSQSYTESCDW